MTNNKQDLTHNFAIGLFFLTLSSSIVASEHQTIDKAIEAYGGDKLLTLKNLTYTDSIYHFFNHQSGHALQGPTTSHLNQIKLEVNIDLDNQNSELKRATKLLVGYHENKNVTTSHRIFKDGKGYNLDHCLGGYQESDRINFNSADLGYKQMLDPLIVRDLVQERSNSTWIDTAYIEGKGHDVFQVNSNTFGEYTVYINQETGLLSRMLQQRGANLRTYNFLEHQNSNGIVWAKQMFVGTEEKPIYHSTSRNLEVNLPQVSKFSIPTSYQVSKPVEPVDVSERTIRELAKGVYYIGQGWGYTLFIDTGSYYISAGAWGMADRSDDWAKALELLHLTTGNNKPVKQHLVSHHHTDHMSELHDVLDHGAKILLHPTDIDSVKNFLKDRKLEPQDFTAISETTYYADGKVMIFDAPSSQASHNLVIYLPEHKILFAEDVFGSSFVNQHHSPRSWPHMDTYQRLTRHVNTIEAMGLEVEQYVSSHHNRVLNKEDIDKAMSISCPNEDEYLKRLFP